jgi:diacylglycerol kinase (ATP)
MAKPGLTGVARLVAATRYSWQGFVKCWHNEAAFRQELYACVVLIPLGLYLGEGGVEKALLVSTCLLVLIVELLNSAIEAVVDRISSELHALSGLAKDLGSAAVLVSIGIVVLTWVLLLAF